MNFNFIPENQIANFVQQQIAALDRQQGQIFPENQIVDFVQQQIEALDRQQAQIFLDPMNPNNLGDFWSIGIDKTDQTIIGTETNDSLFGGIGNDIIDGQAGDDYLYDSTGDNTLLGYFGNDTLISGTGNDILLGEDGDDYLVGSLGFDFNQSVNDWFGIDTYFSDYISTEEISVDPWAGSVFEDLYADWGLDSSAWNTVFEPLTNWESNFSKQN